MPERPNTQFQTGGCMLLVVTRADSREVGWRWSHSFIILCAKSPFAFCTLLTKSSLRANCVCPALVERKTPREKRQSVVGQQNWVNSFRDLCSTEQGSDGSGYPLIFINNNSNNSDDDDNNSSSNKRDNLDSAIKHIRSTRWCGLSGQWKKMRWIMRWRIGGGIGSRHLSPILEHAINSH